MIIIRFSSMPSLLALWPGMMKIDNAAHYTTYRFAIITREVDYVVTCYFGQTITAYGLQE